MNSHSWDCYVEAIDPNWSDSFINEVEFTLHPTFHPPKITIKQHPYCIKRIGWGTFEIKMMVKFKDWIAKEPIKVEHELSFQGNGIRHAFLIDVNKKDYCEALGLEEQEGYMDPQ